MSTYHNIEPLRVACRTLGCRLNQCDTESILDGLRLQRSIAAVGWHEAADLYLLASCTVTAKAAQECRRLARQIKACRPDAKVVVTGCYAQTQPDELAAMPEVDGILGQTAKNQVETWLSAVLDGNERLILVEPLTARGPLAPPPMAPPAMIPAGQSRAFLKIQDGCDMRCAYCQIWQARGPARSLSMDAVAAQVRRMHIERGFFEVVLTGINLGAWGRDLKPPQGLCELLTRLCRDIPDVRLRLSSLHPNEVTPGLLALMADQPHIRPHLHLSLQSGSDVILESMKRPYRSDQADAAASRLVSLDLLFGLGADFIVGFPGESEDDFQATVALCERLPLTYHHVFRYSPRPHTAAAAMKPVPPDIVRQRARVLRLIGRRKQAAFAARMLGTTREAVLERADPRRPKERRATTDNYATVCLTTDLPAGSLIMVRPTGNRGGTLLAELVKVVQEGRR